MSQENLAYSRRLSHIICLVLLASHLLLLNVRSFLSTQMAHFVILLSRSQVLERLLRALGIFLLEDPMLPVKWFLRSLLSRPWIVNNAGGKIPSSLGHPTVPKPMCDGFWNVCRAHETFSIQVKHFGIRV